MIYGLTNSKGGVGKTSIAVHLAAWLIGKRRSIAFIDADPQQSASSWIKDLAIDVRLEQVGDGDELVHRIPEIAAEVDDVVIDGPAGLTATTQAIMVRADRVFLLRRKAIWRRLSPVHPQSLCRSIVAWVS